MQKISTVKKIETCDAGEDTKDIKSWLEVGRKSV